MYYDKSSFPIFLYQVKYDKISLDKIFETSDFIISQKDFEIQFLDNINNKEKQDLFGYLLSVLPSIIISDFRMFRRVEIPKSKFINESIFFELINLRLDLKVIRLKLHELSERDCLESINVEKITLAINLFIHKYVFIVLSEIIASTSINGKEHFFNIKKDSVKFNKFLDYHKNTAVDRIVSQKNFIKGYLESFGAETEESIKDIEKDLIYMTKTINQKKIIKLIFDENIFFSDGITLTRKNDLLLYFFKNVIAKIFYKYLDNHSIDDYEVKTAFNNFRKRV